MKVIVLQDGKTKETLIDVDEILPQMMYAEDGVEEHIRIHQSGYVGSYFGPLKGFEYVIKNGDE